MTTPDMGACTAPAPTEATTQIIMTAGDLRLVQNRRGDYKVEMYCAERWRVLANDLPAATAPVIFAWMQGQEPSRLLALLVYQ